LAANTPFNPGHSISGFRTGTPWLTVENIDAVMPFYVDVLGFGLSNYMQNPFRAYFLHINARHHSLALIGTGRNGMHHLIVEPFGSTISASPTMSSSAGTPVAACPTNSPQMLLEKSRGAVPRQFRRLAIVH
jgi:hypothetical protein